MKNFGDQKSIPCSIYRGGTSKGIFFHKKDLPTNSEKLHQTLLSIMGSPDSRQIDGLGGADPLTSRIAIVSKSKKPDTDIDFQFGLVHIQKPVIDFQGFCGNLISAVGPFAINEKLIPIKKSPMKIRIFDQNTKLHITASIPISNQMAKTDGNFSIDGVPNPGACISLEIHYPIGTITGKLLPTQKPKEQIETSFGILQASLVDCIDPTIFIKASDLHLTGKETPEEISQKTLNQLEEIRLIGAKKMDLSPSGALPKVAFVSKGLHARMIALKKMHKAYAVSCGICTAVASRIPNTLVNECQSFDTNLITIQHPQGKMDIFVEQDLSKVRIDRTARCLMRGAAFLSKK